MVATIHGKDRELTATNSTFSIEILALDANNIVGDATGLCESAENLKTFTYGCEQVICHGACCSQFCCNPEAIQDGRSEQCFSTLLSTALQHKDEIENHDFEANRTIFSFSPEIRQEP